MATSEPANNVRRLNINLPKYAFDELKSLSTRSGRSMTEVVRTALSLARLAFDEEQKNNKLVVADGEGNLLKEIVLPK